MITLTHKKPLNRWDHSSIRPGVVGPVGCPLMTERLKATYPGNFRWVSEYHGRREALYGSNISDGQSLSFNSGGGPARLINTNWGGRREFKTKYGYEYQDIRAPDMMVEPMVGSLPQYSWRNKLATVNKALHTGDLFTIPIRGLVEQPNGVTRGGMYPRVTDVVGSEPPPEPQNINNGTPQIAPNFKPQLSSFSDQNPLRTQKDANSHMKGGTLGRMNR